MHAHVLHVNVQLDGSPAHHVRIRLKSATRQDFINVSHACITCIYAPLIAVQVIAYIIRHRLPTRVAHASQYHCMPSLEQLRSTLQAKWHIPICH